MATEQTGRKPKDRDFILTHEGMFFCVTGYLHPPDRYTAYLKYSPDPHGTWQKGEIAYRRDLPYYHVSNVAETIRYLEQHYPHYVTDCPVRNIRFSMVPQQAVARYYNPQERLRLVIATPNDPLEEEAGQLALAIADCAGINLNDIGLTGSILLEMHNPILSDINLLVYGLENGWKVRAAFLNGHCSQIQSLDKTVTERWQQEMQQWFPITGREAQYLVGRRWNYGLYNRRFFGIHPTRTNAEITEQYGDHIYRSLGNVRIRATVTAVNEAILQPAVYKINNVQMLEGTPAAKEVNKIISYEGRYRDVVEQGEQIEAQGKLESVDGRPRRVVIGTTQLAGKEYIKPVIDWGGDK